MVGAGCGDPMPFARGCGRGGSEWKRRKSRSAVEEEEEVQRGEKIPQLLSYEVLAREPQALKWFTGLKEGPLKVGRRCP